MDEIVISVIIPVYNSEKFIEKCINSILSQSFTDFEIIAVDDGSTDSSPDILNAVSKTDSRLKVYSKANGGVSSARNYGIEMAQGEYISFVDSDDELPRDALKILYENTDDSIDLISGSYHLTGAFRHDIIHTAQRFTNAERLTRFEEQDHTNWGPCGKLYRKSIVDRYNIRFREDISYSEDHIFNLNYTKNIKNDMLVISDVVYSYNNSLRDNLCSRAIRDIGYIYRVLFETVVDYFDGSIDKALYDKYLYELIIGAVNHIILNFPANQTQTLVRDVFGEFDKYIDGAFADSRFSEGLSKAIKEKDYNSFVAQYKAENPKLKIRRALKIAKNLAAKALL